jgi:hypothetical protein
MPARASPNTAGEISIRICTAFHESVGKNIRGVIVVVFVVLGKEAVSVVSMRPASKNERKLYAER